MTKTTPASARNRVRPCCEQLEDRMVPAGLQPTAMEQLLLEQLNDARADPVAYGQSIGLNLSGVNAAQPLAFNTLLIQAAHQHSQDMNDRNFFDHVNPDSKGPGQRFAAAGFTANSWGESIAAGYSSTASALSALIKDAGVADLGHRRHLLAIDTIFQTQNQVGIGVVQNGGGSYGNYYTIDTARSSDGRAFLTGAVFKDQDHDGRYDVGEGLSGVTITVAGVGAISAFNSGGYSFQLSPGNYTVTASGGGLTNSITRTVTIGTGNVRVQFIDGGDSQGLQNQRWVSQLYVDLMGRQADAGGLVYWVGQLAQGTTREQVASAFVNSVEFRQNLVQNHYQTYLNRTAGQAEVSGWVSFLNNGGSADQIRIGFLASDEYFVINGNSNANFVSALYVDVLGRTADAGGHASFTNALNQGMSRTAVSTALVTSTENRLREVRSFYVNYLRRQGEPTAVTAWANVLIAGARQTDLIVLFVSSEEYYRRLG